MKKIIFLIILMFNIMFNNITYSQQPQSASKILMIRPLNFGYNEETSNSNNFQQKTNTLTNEEIQKKALEEFDTAVSILRNKGVNVIVFEDTKEPIKPDAVFSNNWISFLPNGKIFMYPLNAKNRRLERRMDIVMSFYKNHTIKEFNDWSIYEIDKQYLEGTGSIVFDHLNQVLFASLSSRTDEKLVNKLAENIEYAPFIFNAIDQTDKAIYHTNVVMSIGTEFAVICSQSIKDNIQKEKIFELLKTPDREIIDISYNQMNKFAGNILELKNKDKKTLIVMSKTAFESFNLTQINTFKKFGEIVVIPIPIIEKIGGGSIRCMITEVFLK